MLKNEEMVNISNLETFKEKQLMNKIKNHGEDLQNYFAKLKKNNVPYVEIIIKLLDFEMEYLTKLGQVKVANAYLSEIFYKGEDFDINKYPLHNLLIECTFMAREAGEITNKYSGGFIWQIIVDSFQSHLLDWIISENDYKVKEKLINHVSKIIDIFIKDIC